MRGRVPCGPRLAGARLWGNHGKKKKVHIRSQHDKTEAYEEGAFKCEIGCTECALRLNAVIFYEFA